MAACAHGAGYDSCPPNKVAQDFNQADKGTKRLKRAVRRVRIDLAAGDVHMPGALDSISTAYVSRRDALKRRRKRHGAGAHGQIETIGKFNEHHDEHGRFASSDGVAAAASPEIAGNETPTSPAHSALSRAAGNVLGWGGGATLGALAGGALGVTAAVAAAPLLGAAAAVVAAGAGDILGSALG